MSTPSSGGQKHGLPIDPNDRRRIREGLNEDEKKQLDDIIKKIDGGGRPDKNQRKFIRQLKGQGKIPIPSKSFRAPSDRKTHH